jgi:hypothetical protein
MFELVGALAYLVAAKVTLNPHTQNRRVRHPNALRSLSATRQIRCVNWSVAAICLYVSAHILKRQALRSTSSHGVSPG